MGKEIHQEISGIDTAMIEKMSYSMNCTTSYVVGVDGGDIEQGTR